MPPTNENWASTSKLRRIYESLPSEAQKKLVDEQLKTLLGSLPAEKAKKVASAASRLQKKYTLIPDLDLKGKKKEIRLLLNDLRRDAKCSFLKERSNRSEILSEIIESLVSWLGDIWKVVYEHKAYFSEAHACLLYAWGVITELSNHSSIGGCNCSITNLPMLVVVKSSTGKVIKRFSYSDPQNTDRVLLWIWRELFISMYVTRGSHARKKIPEMLLDIEDCMEWSALERLLHGGNHDDEWFDEDDDDDLDEDDEDEEDEDDYAHNVIYYSDLRANHWSKKMSRKRFLLRDLVLQRLETLFKLNPSLGLYNAIAALSPDPDSAGIELLDSLSAIATGSSTAFAAALDIYNAVNEPQCIHELAVLLRDHCHLIRPQDSQSYQDAVMRLFETPLYRKRAVEILEAELRETIHTIRLEVQSCFKGLNEGTSKVELERVLRLSQGSQQRVDRVENWVDSVVTPSAGPFPLAFAAMMMGFPNAALDDGEDGDFVALMDMDPSDPDLADLREEYQPRLRDRFEGWTEVAMNMKKESSLLTKLYVKMVEDMPYLRARDVADEMTARLRDRPSKAHVCDALDALAEFSQIQRKRIFIKIERKRNKQTSNTSTANMSSGSGQQERPRSGFTFSFSTGPVLSTPTTAVPPTSTFGGLDDVD